MKTIAGGVMLTAAVLCGGLATAKEVLHGPEAWLELMGGNVRKDGLRCDLEAIKAAGFSGVHFFHIGRAGVWPDCPEQIPCLSEKWDDLVTFLGAECKRLGLRLTVQNCPGWSQSGGPWVDLDHCQRHLRMARADLSGGEKFRLPPVPKEFADRDSDWRDVAALAFPTPAGDEGEAFLTPQRIETNGLTRIFRFAEPVTVRSLVLPWIDPYNPRFSYEMPWMRVALAVRTPDGWKDVVRTPLPTSNWRDYVETLTIACAEAKGTVWRYTFEHDRPIVRYGEPRLSSAARMTDWEGKSARTLRSLSRSPAPVQSKWAWIDAAKIVDLTGKADWTVPAGRWTVLRLGSVNAKYVNAPAPKEATGWECDKLDPAGIEANFRGYIGRLAAGPLKNRISGFLVDSWECFGQTWTPKMEKYFADANGYPLRMWLPALFGWVVGSPERTETFLTDWRRTNGDLITKNYYGRMAELAHAAGLSVLYETAFGDIIHGDLLEYWKYADAPMCEFWFPHVSRDEAFVGSYAFKPIRPCASAAHIYAKPRVIAEAFTEWGISWKEDLRSLRDDANRHFARGVTHLAFQSYTHAPNPKALPPGGCMGGYNGTPFTRLQTWWKHMPEFTRWLRECEERLESGRPAEDVLWYLGDAVDHKPDENFAFPEGFRADYLNHDVLVNRLSVKEGKFAIPEGTTWRILWVPDTRFMRPATKAKLAELAAAGGTVVYGDKRTLQKALARLERDVATEPALGDEPSEDFMWIHRTEGSVERYFVAAGTNGFGGKVTFRAKGPVSIYDPVSRLHSAWTNGTPLRLARSQSVFVEFGAEDNFKSAVHLLSPPAFSAPWKLSFTPGWDAPASVTLDRLVPWCEIPGFSPAARAYSGTVAYETNFNLDLDLLLDHLALDLGRVEDVAVVYVNGKEVRTLWCEPYTCDISRFVRKGRNDLRIEVTGTWHNRVFYDQTLPEGERKTWALLHQPPRKDVCSTFIPQGLLGPVIKMVTPGACLAGPDARGVRNAIATSSAERALVRQLGPCRVVRVGGRTVVELEKREYHVARGSSSKRDFWISNHTDGPSHPIGLDLRGATNLTVRGNGATIVFHDACAGVAIEDAKNVRLENLKITWSRPIVTEGEIVRFDKGETTIRIDRNLFPYRVEKGGLVAVGDGWEYGSGLAMTFSGCTREIVESTTDFVLRGAVRENPDGTVTIAQDFSTGGKVKVGDALIFRPWSRPYPAVFVYHATDTVLEDVAVHTAWGIGLIAQMSENVTWRGTRSALDRTSGCFPPAGSKQVVSLHADASHFSNVKGRVTVENCLFETMMDDAVNVHSTCLGIVKVAGDRKLRCRYMHAAATGFGVFNAGDRLRFIRGKTLENDAETEVVAVELHGHEEMTLTLADALPAGIDVGDAVENADYQPSVICRGNVIRNNRARGVLFTTPKPVVCESNRFDHVSGAAILFAGDAQGWYESGACADAVVRGNVFNDCLTSRYQFCDAVIAIWPMIREPAKQQRHYHRNIRIEGNVFNTFDVPLLYARSADDLVFRGNKVNRNTHYTGWGQPAFNVQACDRAVVEPAQ